MSQERRQILEMLQEGKISQEDATRLLDALGEEDSTPLVSEKSPAEEVPQEKEQDAQWEEEHRDDEDCQGPNQRVEIHLEGEAATPFLQEITAALDEAGPALERLGAKVDDAVNRASQAVEAAWPEVRDALKDTGEKARGAAKTAVQAARESVLAEAVVPGKLAVTPLPLEENAYQEPPIGGPITQIKVEWVNGPVEIRPWQGDTIRVAEYAARPLKEGEQMELREKDGRLSIQWRKGSLLTAGKLFLKKHLVVELPQQAVLEKIQVESVSGGVYVESLQAGKVKLETVSGSLSGRGISAEEIGAETTSGQLELAGVAAQRLRCETVSGSLTVLGNGEAVKLNTVSGPLNLQVGQYPREMKLETVSGSLQVTLPEGGPGFTVDYDSVSGGFTSQFPLAGNLGKRHGKAVYGKGGATLHLETVSGKMALYQAQNPGNS